MLLLQKIIVSLLLFINPHQSIPFPGPNHVFGSADVFSFHRSITIDHTQAGSTDSTNFPLVWNGTFTYLKTVGNSGNVQNPSGFDVIFTSDSACTTKLNWETVVYSATTGTNEYWIEIPTLSHTVDTVIYVCYGNPVTSTDQSNATGTYDSNYKGIWHFPNGTSLTLADSTTNANNGTNVNTVTAAAGNIDGAASFVSASTQYITVGSAASLTGIASDITVSAWVKYTATLPTSNFPMIIGGSDGTNGYELLVHQTSSIPYFQLVKSTTETTSYTGVGTALLANTWYYIVGVYNTGASNQLTCYVNAADSGHNFPAAAIGASSGIIDIGRRESGAAPTVSWDGQIDEVRISNSARSGDWVLSEYNNQKSGSTMLTVSAPL